jgi:transcriptional/translational regulatory protein YebC/TACO1
VARHQVRPARRAGLRRPPVREGLLTERESLDTDALMEAALDAGADDVREDGDPVIVVTLPAAFEAVKLALEQRGFRALSAEVTLDPLTTVSLTDTDAEAMLKLSEALEDLDDIQAVYANFDISDEVMQRLAS